jgi:hypothetical protein
VFIINIELTFGQRILISHQYLPLIPKENLMTETLETQDAPILSYPLASGDMRYIEIGEREIYLRKDPKLGLVFRGEISGCGSDCFVELNEILLEYAMSCEGCREEIVAAKEVSCFGELLGKILVANIVDDIINMGTIDKLSTTFKCILNSMSSKYIEQASTDRLEYSLDCCPLRECARDTGLNRSVEMAQISFVALCRYITNSLAPKWELVEPTESGNNPIHKIVIAVS